MILKFLFKVAESPLFQDISIIFSVLVLIMGSIYIYKNTKNSRKYYICPRCGKNFRVEHMKAKYCDVCGCELKEIFLENNE